MKCYQGAACVCATRPYASNGFYLALRGHVDISFLGIGLGASSVSRYRTLPNGMTDDAALCFLLSSSKQRLLFYNGALYIHCAPTSCQTNGLLCLFQYNGHRGVHIWCQISVIWRTQRSHRCATGILQHLHHSNLHNPPPQ